MSDTQGPRISGSFSVELRRYTLRPGARKALVDLFASDLVSAQELCGMRVFGQFRDFDSPDSFVWLRGFADLDARTRALRDFYEGSTWSKFADQANLTMVNSDDVLLLRPAGDLPFLDNIASNGGIVEIATCSLPPGAETGFLSFFEESIRPSLECTGGRLSVPLVTEKRSNPFPRLPVREGEPVFVWLVAYETAAAWAWAQDQLAASNEWRGIVLPGLQKFCWRQPHIARLAATPPSSKMQ